MLWEAIIMAEFIEELKDMLLKAKSKIPSIIHLKTKQKGYEYLNL
jgi:hypothetical protein